MTSSQFLICSDKGPLCIFTCRLLNSSRGRSRKSSTCISFYNNNKVDSRRVPRSTHGDLEIEQVSTYIRVLDEIFIIHYDVPCTIEVLKRLHSSWFHLTQIWFQRTYVDCGFEFWQCQSLNIMKTITWSWMHMMNITSRYLVCP